MESKITITLSWEGPVIDEHISQLENAGQVRAFEMIPEGYGSGELNAVLNFENDNGETVETEYRGWWSVSFESN